MAYSTVQREGGSLFRPLSSCVEFRFSPSCSHAGRPQACLFRHGEILTGQAFTRTMSEPSSTRKGSRSAAAITARAARDDIDRVNRNQGAEMALSNSITLSRDCEAIEIPCGRRATLPSITAVRVMQSLGNTYTVATDRGYMYRIDASNADAFGISPAPAQPPTAPDGVFNKQMVWAQLRTVHDPEIPVNIVDLGLIYSCEITQLEEGARKIDIKISMAAPGCGISNVFRADVENKLSRLPSVKEVSVDVVFDPPWNLSRMTEAARWQLGI